MPIPAPAPEETKLEFLRRCLSDATMQREYPDEAQRFAVCVGQWGSEAEARGAGEGGENDVKTARKQHNGG